MTRQRRITPGGQTEGDLNVLADTYSLGDLDDIAQQTNGAFVAVVRTLDAQGGPHVRRRPYLSLAAAEAAVRRAQDRGQHAEVVLCRLVPVNVVVVGGGDVR